MPDTLPHKIEPADPASALPNTVAMKNGNQNDQEEQPVPARQLAETLAEGARLLGQPLAASAILSGLAEDRELHRGFDVVGINNTLEKASVVAQPGFVSFDQAKNFQGVGIALVRLTDNRQGCLLLDGTGEQAIARMVTAKGAQAVEWSRLSQAWTGQILTLGQKPSINTDQSQQQGKSWLWQTLRQQVSSYRYVWLAALVINIFALVLPMFNLAVYDRVAPNGAINTLWTLAIGVFLILIFDFIMKQLRSHLVDTAARRVDITVSRQIYERLLGLKMEHRIGAAGNMADVLRGFSSVQEFFSSATLVVLIDLPFVVLFITLIYVIGGPLVFVPLIAGPLAVLVAVILQGPLSKASKEATVNGQSRQGTLVESISNLEMIRAIGAERVMRRRWQDQVNASALSGMKVKVYGQLASQCAAFLQQLASVSMIIGGVYLITAGEMTMGALIAVNMLGGRAMQPFTQIAGLLSRTYHAKIAFEQISEFMVRPQLRSEDEHFLSRADLGKGLQLLGASFSYPAEQPVQNLQSLNLRIEPGERVAIIGRIGSGKSTLLKLLAGIYGPDKGSAQIGGVDTRQIAPAELRSHVGYVGQDPMLFSGSLRSNICMGHPEASDIEILAAARLAGVEQFVSQHPDGYQRVLGERGAGLSSGQRQSVAVAQAVLQKPAVLMMDEPTSAMDPTTEAILIQRLKGYIDKQKSTLVLVTHTPALLALVDRLVVVENGRIAMDGPKKQVLDALRNGNGSKTTTRAVHSQNRQTEVQAQG